MSDITDKLQKYIENVDYNTRCADLAEAIDEIERLRAALKPFADLAEKYGGDVDDQPLWDRDFMPVVGDLRAAKAALGESDD